MSVSVVEVEGQLMARIMVENDKPTIRVEARIAPKLVASVECSVENIEEAVALVCNHLATEVRRQLVARHQDVLQRTNPNRRY